MANPYDRKLGTKSFLIDYQGMADQFYCFRIHLHKHAGMDAWAFRSAVSQWLLKNARGRNLIGNGFTASKTYPNVPFENEGGKDCFVLFEKMIDVAMFEDAFVVTGFSPTMTA